LCADVGQYDSKPFDWYAFDIPINSACYAEMKDVWLRHSCLMKMWMQHDGPPAHFTLTVCDQLNRQFLCC